MINQQNNEVAIWMYSKAGQLQPAGRPHNSLRTRLRAALVYTYFEMGVFQFTGTPLFIKNKLR
jgi:hypothetical protein